MPKQLASIILLLIASWTYGQDIELEEKLLSIYFENDSYEINPDYINSIDSILLKNKVTKFDAIGFASEVGSKKHNQNLSAMRAKAASDYLISRNLTGSSEGKGEDVKSTINIGKQRRVDLILFCEVPAIVEALTVTQVVNKDLISKDSLLSIIKHTDTISLKSIQFFGGKAVFFPTELPPQDLYYLAEIMDSIPYMEISIQGHVCCGHDLRLSERRAEAVYYVLRKEGIAAARMSVIGFSNTRLKVPDTKPLNNQTNRRVEIIITKR
jgi:outer membrane protein OmpA-like peptidoglycan-associated protein